MKIFQAPWFKRFCCGVRFPIILATVIILTLYSVLFTGCVSNTAATPSIYLFTIRKAGNWLRIGNIGSCFGTGNLLSKPVTCAPTVLSGKDDFAGADGVSLVRHAKAMQLAILPLFSILSVLCYLISAGSFFYWESTRPHMYQAGTKHNRLTFKSAYISVALALVALFQMWASVFGMAHASAIVENHDLEVKLSTVGLGLQSGALGVQFLFALGVKLKWSSMMRQRKQVR